MTSLAQWAKSKTEYLTFVQLKEGITLNIEGYQVPQGGLYVPVLTTEMANRIQTSSEDEVLTLPSIIRGVLYLLGADESFVHRKAYEHLLTKLQKETKIIAYETSEGFEKQGNFEEAVLFMRGYCSIHKDDDRAQVMLGAFYVRLSGGMSFKETQLEKESMMEALRLLESVQPRHEKNVLLLFYLATVYRWQKSYLKAEKVWKDALNVSQNSKEKKLVMEKLEEIHPFARYEEGYQLVIQGSPEEGLVLLKPLLQQQPLWWNLHFFIAVAYQQLGDWDQAIHHYGQVLEIKGYHQQTAMELSEIYLAMSEHERAVHWMEEVLLQKPGDPELLCRMALMKAYVGNRTEAFDYLEKAENAGGNENAINSVKERLNAL